MAAITCHCTFCNGMLLQLDPNPLTFLQNICSESFHGAF